MRRLVDGIGRVPVIIAVFSLASQNNIKRLFAYFSNS